MFGVLRYALAACVAALLATSASRNFVNAIDPASMAQTPMSRTTPSHMMMIMPTAPVWADRSRSCGRFIDGTS